MTNLPTNTQACDFPVKFEVCFQPKTGSLRPFEIWAFCKSGHSAHRGSFKTQAAALKSATARANNLNKYGVHTEVIVK